MTLSIGVVTNEHRSFVHTAQISELATEMKAYAKTFSGSIYVVDRRHGGPWDPAASGGDNRQTRGCKVHERPVHALQHRVPGGPPEGPRVRRAGPLLHLPRRLRDLRHRARPRPPAATATASAAAAPARDAGRPPRPSRAPTPAPRRASGTDTRSPRRLRRRRACARAARAASGSRAGGVRPRSPFGASDPNAKARRLARALVSDIVTYHPERRDKALANGTLKSEFMDEIKKSWEEYVGQVGADAAAQHAALPRRAERHPGEGAAAVLKGRSARRVPSAECLSAARITRPHYVPAYLGTRYLVPRTTCTSYLRSLRPFVPTRNEYLAVGLTTAWGRPPGRPLSLAETSAAQHARPSRRPEHVPQPARRAGEVSLTSMPAGKS